MIIENETTNVSKNCLIRMSVHDIKKIIEKKEVKTISFDLFDTLLVRPSIKPKDVFYLLRGKVKEKYGLDFVKLRFNAEDELKKKNASLEEIWNHIALKNHLSLETAFALMQEEVNLELSLLTVRYDIKDIYDYAVSLNKNIIVVSDMYLSSEVLKKALDKNGYAQIGKIYVSCECQCRKDDGSLFDFVLKKEEINKTSGLVHIGDNFYSDFKSPLEKGITAIYYPSVWDIVLNSNTAWGQFVSYKKITEDPYMRILYSYSFLKLYNTQDFVFSKKYFFGNLTGFSVLFLSPLIVSVVLSIINNPDIIKTYLTISFAARDGYLPKIIYDIISKGLNVPQSNYLYVSRQALSYSIYKDFFDYFDNMNFGYEVYYLEDFIKTVLIDEILKSNIINSMSEKEKKLDLHLNAIGCRKVLMRYKNSLNKYFAEQKHYSKQYYSSIFSSGPKRELVFDCGYSGSVSRGLSKACGNEEKYFDKYYLWESGANRSADKNSNTKTFCFFSGEPSLGLNIILEECFSPLQGSCLGFVSDNNVKPLCDVLFPSDAMKEDMNKIYDACIDYAKDFSKIFKDYLGSFNIIERELLIDIGYQGFLLSPYMELDMFKEIKFVDSNVGGTAISLSSKIHKIFVKEKYYINTSAGTRFKNPDSILLVPVQEKHINANIGIHLHIYNKYLYDEFFYYLKGFPYHFDLIVTITDESFRDVLKNVFSSGAIPNINSLIIYKVENRGRDVAPWLINTKELQKNYDYFCHIHAKVSTQYDNNFGERWRHYLLDNLVSCKAAEDILAAFENDRQLGCVFPRFFYDLEKICVDNSISLFGVDGESEIIERLLKRMNIPERFDHTYSLWSAGTMLWYRPKALKPMFDLNLEIEEFPKEPIGVGGTIAHALERMVTIIANYAGYHTKLYNVSSEMCRTEPIIHQGTIGVKGALHNWFYKKLKPETAKILCNILRL